MSSSFQFVQLLQSDSVLDSISVIVTLMPSDLWHSRNVCIMILILIIIMIMMIIIKT